MTKKELGQKIKEKYPEYNNLDDEVLADKIIEKYPVYKKQISDTSVITTQPEEKKKGLLGKVGEFFTGSTQKFGKTLGTAASVVSPTVKKEREAMLKSTQSQVDNYLKLAKQTTDKEKKKRFLQAAQSIADTSDIDIYNNPEYQKTAKQVFGEAAGTALETLSAGSYGKVATAGMKTGKLALKAVPTAVSGVKTLTAGKMALKSAATGGALGGLTSGATAMAEGKTNKEILKSTATGAATGALIGGALGYGTGKITGKISEKKATELVSAPLTQKSKELAYRTGRATEAGLLKSEKILPTTQEKELGKVAQNIGLRVGKSKSNINKVNKNITKEAEALKEVLKNTGAIYNKNNVKGALNKMRDDVTVDLVDSEIKVYDKMIDKFNKMVEANENKGLDGLLESRQLFDQWLKSNNPNIFVNKQGAAYRASKAVRESINNYINQQVKDDVVKNSLKFQSNLYTILENISKKAAGKGIKLKSSTVKRVGKKLKVPAAIAAAGAVGLKIGSGANKPTNYSQYTSGE